jgi:hypothetical protein
MRISFELSKKHRPEVFEELVFKLLLKLCKMRGEFFLDLSLWLRGFGKFPS